MSGPQFLHIQSYSRKANKVGQNVQQILGEVARLPEFSQHVEIPQPPNLIYGLTPEEVRRKHDEIVQAGCVEVTLKDGTTAQRSIRKDRHTLLTAVASYPLLTRQVIDGSRDRTNYENWRELNVCWLIETFGERLVSIVEHTDEMHPHIHAFILPLGDPSCSARHLNPAWKSKEEAETFARDGGKPPKEAVKLGNLAYRARGRELQDQYFTKVGLPSGLTRIGPKRERLSRKQWKQRKEQAQRDAVLLRQMQGRVESIAEIEAQFDAYADKRAFELIEKLEIAEATLANAVATKNEAEKAAQMIRAHAETEMAAMKHDIRTKLSEQTKQLKIQANDLQSARSAFELEKRAIARETVLRVASITARVFICILTDNIRINSTQSALHFDDPKLAYEVEQLEISATIQKAVRLFSKIWGRLTLILPNKIIDNEREHQIRELKPVAKPLSKGIEL
jgi:hypothetical protein